MRFLRSPLGQFAAAFALIYVLLAFGFQWFLRMPRIPSNYLGIYVAIALVSLLIYVTSEDDRMKGFLSPIVAVFTQEKHKLLRGVIFVLFPALVGWEVWGMATPKYSPPFENRIVHPEPPNDFAFRGKTVAIRGLENPLRKDKAKLPEHIAEGKRIYYQNCFFCHGDKLDGQGPMANGFNPIPMSFVDKGTIAQLQESFVFWRISTGGPGLSAGSLPWSSAMPVWQNLLTEDEIWKVVLYIYEGAGVEPRTWE